jgi:hypothetical protein
MKWRHYDLGEGELQKRIIEEKIMFTCSKCANRMIQKIANLRFFECVNCGDLIVNPLLEFVEEAKKEIPPALIYGTQYNKDGYCHDDVWEMMDWIKKWFGETTNE